MINHLITPANLEAESKCHGPKNNKNNPGTRFKGTQLLGEEAE